MVVKIDKIRRGFIKMQLIDDILEKNKDFTKRLSEVRRLV
jgi:hypothetical protein